MRLILDAIRKSPTEPFHSRRSIHRNWDAVLISYGLHGTPLAGTTPLHICVEFDEIEIARWLIEHGANVNARAEIDADGFGGHTPLFGSVVNNSYLNGRQHDGGVARLLLDHGADPNARASIRKQIHFVPDESMREYRDVAPLAWVE